MEKTATIVENANESIIVSDAVISAYEGCSPLHKEILKVIYNLQDPYISFNKLYVALKRYLSPRTLRRKIYDLRDSGLISTSNEGVLCISRSKECGAEVVELMRKDLYTIFESRLQ